MLALFDLDGTLYDHRAEERWRTADLDALRRLREAGWRIGIVTNGSVYGQRRKLAETGIDALVDGWCISDDIGVTKPDPAIFIQAATAAGAAIEDGDWMVGNSLPGDIVGGRAAGLRTILIFDGEPSPEADFTVRTAADAVDVILREGSVRGHTSL